MALECAARPPGSGGYAPHQGNDDERMELNAAYNRIRDLQQRIEALRGYL